MTRIRSKQSGTERGRGRSVATLLRAFVAAFACSVAAPISWTCLVWMCALPLAGCAAPLTPTLDVTPASQTLPFRQPLALTVTRRFSGGGVEDVTSRVTYTTSDRSVATVNDRGVVTAGTVAGSVIVKVFDPMSDASVAVTITVVAPQIASIELNPSPSTVLKTGATQAFTATARFTDGSSQDVTKTARWTSTVPSVATVGDGPQDKGIVSAKAEGTTTIVATDPASSIEGRAGVVVPGDAPQLKALIVTPNGGIVAVGKTLEFKAQGVLSDGSTSDVTSQVTWSSSRTDIATVDSGGIVTGVAAGDTTITATGPQPSTAVKGSAAAKVVP